MISKETIDQIFAISKLEEVIGDFMELKKAGSNYKGLSPFTAEKTPSFVVSPAKQIWKDFSSGKGGNVVSFLIEHEQFTYPEALEYLAKKYHIEIQKEGISSKEEVQKRSEKETLFLIQNKAKDFFINQLFKSKESQEKAIDYIKKRKLSAEIVKKFELGYAAESWDFFTKSFLEKGFSKEQLISSGLSISGENRLFDRFRGRLIFPIHSFSGRILGFAARSLKSSPNEAKYLNSPENEIYQKGKLLYGLYQAKQAILRENEVYLVEGYLDVISLFQAGVENVVASGGTALTKEQIYLLKRLTSNVVLLYDGDQAGIDASIRATDLFLKEELNVNLISLPSGEDPDSFAQKYSSQELKEKLSEKKENFINFKLKSFSSEIQKDPIKKASFVSALLSSVAKISSPIHKELYIQEISIKLGLSQETLFRTLAQLERLWPKEKSPKKPTLEINSERFSDPLFISEKEIIRLLLCFGNQTIYLENDVLEGKKEKIQTTITAEIIKEFEADELKFSDEFHQELFDKVLKAYKKGEILAENFFLHANDSRIQVLLSSYSIEPYSLANWESRGIEVTKKEEKLAQLLIDTLLRYKSNYLSKLIKEFSNELTKNKEAQPSLLKKIMRLTALKNEINKKLHRFV